MSEKQEAPPNNFMKVTLIIIVVVIVGLVVIPNLTPPKQARVTVTKESKGVFTIEIQQGSNTQIFLRYVEFSYQPNPNLYVWITEKVTKWTSSGTQHYTIIHVDLTIWTGDRFQGGTVTFVFNDWPDIEKS